MKYSSSNLVLHLKYEMYHEKREYWMEILNIGWNSELRMIQFLNGNSLS